MVAALATAQQALERHTPALQRACVATCTAHITLGVMHLPTGEHCGGGGPRQQPEGCTGSDAVNHIANRHCTSDCTRVAPCCRGAAAGLLQCGGGAG